jgi:hypothetical protein
MLDLERRQFITLLGGAAVAWPLAARAQQGERMRRIGILMAYPESDAAYQGYVMAFREELQKLGWQEGRNVSDPQRNSSRCSPTSFFPQAHLPLRRFCNKRRPFPSFSRTLSIRSPVVSSLAYQGRVAMPLAT